jgi:hypothetical protein
LAILGGCHRQVEVDAKLMHARKDCQMPPQVIFLMQTALSYVAWLLCFRAYFWPRLKSMDSVQAQRAIATLHSFRFFGLVFILPGIVSASLPAGFAPVAAYLDLTTGILAILALAAVSVKPVFWTCVVAFNSVGSLDFILDYYHAARVGLPAVAGQLGAAYMIPVLYVPLLMITHVTAFYFAGALTKTASQRNWITDARR